MDICNLYTLTEFSFLNSVLKIENIIKFKKTDASSKYISISDDNMSGFYKFNKMALENDLKPLFSINLKITNYHFIIYIKNNLGYYNLLSLNQKINEKKDISLDDLKEFEDNLIFILLLKDIDYFYLKEDINFLKKLKNLYIQYDLNNPILNFLNFNDFKYIPILKQTYLYNDEKNAYISLKKIEKDEEIKEKFYKYFSYEEFYNFYENKEIYLNLENLIKSIDFSLPKTEFNLPIYSNNSENLLKDILIKSLKEKNLYKNQKYIERLNHEFKIIKNLNFIDYFLIVYDIVNYSKSNDILIGPGRGSAVGSLISYLLNITEVDPLKYNLYFERFLNPYRKTMPDIDIDFPDDKREEVIKYCIKKYGVENVCLISTYDTFQIKSITRDLIKQYNIKDYIKQEIIEQITNSHPDLENEVVSDILKKSEYIKGLYKNRSTHASGVIISNKSLLKTIPLIKLSQGYFQSLYQMSELEEMGLLKIDFLGLKNLSIIKQIITLIKKEDKDFDLNNIPLDDKKTYELINSLDLDGIFQLETTGIKNVIKKVKIDEFEDLVSILALFRPGPMENIDLFSKNKHSKVINYLHKDLEPILEKTYGIIVYQEQIMEICKKIANYSLADADLFRRAISKKNEDILDKEKPKFISSCISNGYDYELAIKLFDYIYKFANYGFNRSHSVAYSLISYRMCYLKANYPVYFYTVLLNNCIGNDKLTYTYLKKLSFNNVKIYPPLINKALSYYKINKNNILMPFSIIKNVSQTTINKIIEERQKEEFKSFLDFKNRCKDFIDENILKQLIYSNSFYLFEKNINNLLKNSKIFNLKVNFSLFNINEVVNETEEKINNTKLMEYEKKAFGFNIIYDLFKSVDKDYLIKNGFNKISKLEYMNKVLTLVEILDIKEIKTKNNEKMAFIKISDGESEVEVTCFNELYKKFLNIFDKNNKKLYKIILRKDNYNNKISYYIQEIDLFV